MPSLVDDKAQHTDILPAGVAGFSVFSIIRLAKRAAHEKNSSKWVQTGFKDEPQPERRFGTVDTAVFRGATRSDDQDSPSANLENFTIDVFVPSTNSSILFCCGNSRYGCLGESITAASTGGTPESGDPSPRVAAAA
jgi:hypothetical protein